nr:MAG TPA: hypothetical protein [Caudoviricetes sp.]
MLLPETADRSGTEEGNSLLSRLFREHLREPFHAQMK